jgi:transposase
MENLTKTYVGIDISKASFEVAYRNAPHEKHQKRSYTFEEESMILFVKNLPPHAHCVMEYTGNYHLRLLYFLVEQGVNVSVVKGEKVRYFAKIHDKITKTDSQDAILLCEYAQVYHPELFVLPSDDLVRLKQKRMFLDQLQKQKRVWLNHQEALSQCPVVDDVTQKAIQSEIEHLNTQIEAVQGTMENYMLQHYATDLANLQTIPSVKKVIAMRFLEVVSTFQGFMEAKNSKSFVKFIGLAPTAYQSGTSVKKKSTLSKVAHTDLKARMYMPIVSICTTKKDNIFKQYYLSLKQRGKTSKEAIMAVMHKVIRIMVAVVKTRQPFSLESYGKTVQKVPH